MHSQNKQSNTDRCSVWSYFGRLYLAQGHAVHCRGPGSNNDLYITGASAEIPPELQPLSCGIQSKLQSKSLELSSSTIQNDALLVQISGLQIYQYTYRKLHIIRLSPTVQWVLCQVHQKLPASGGKNVY